MARTLPDCTCGTDVEVTAMNQLDMARNQVDDRRAAAFIRYVARTLVLLLNSSPARWPGLPTPDGVVQAALLLGMGNEFLDVFGRNRRMHDQDVGGVDTA